MRNINKQFAKRLKAIRVERSMTQEDLARKAGISREYLARLETARQDPTLNTMAKIAKALKVKMVELFG